jgi:hypothetical protein
VSSVASRSKESVRNDIERSIFHCSGEGMFWVMAMLLGTMARNAEIIILAGCAGNEVLLGKFLNA